MEDTLDAVFSGHEVILADGRKVALSKMKVRYLKPTLALIRKVIAGVSFATASAPVMTGDAGVLAAAAPESLITPDVILQLIADNLDDALTLISYHTSLTNEEMQELDLDAALPIIGGVVALNYDFFTSQVLPLLNRNMESADRLRQLQVRKT